MQRRRVMVMKPRELLQERVRSCKRVSVLKKKNWIWAVERWPFLFRICPVEYSANISLSAKLIENDICGKCRDKNDENELALFSIYSITFRTRTDRLKKICSYVVLWLIKTRRGDSAKRLFSWWVKTRLMLQAGKRKSHHRIPMSWSGNCRHRCCRRACSRCKRIKNRKLITPNRRRLPWIFVEKIAEWNLVK